jgi:HlyD family secretion protein
MIEHKEGVLKIPNSALRFRPESAKAEGPVEKRKEPSSKEPSAQEKGRAGLERLKSELNLTAEQQSKMDMILQSSRAEIQEIRGKAKPEEASIRIRALIRQKIWGILTEEQKKKLNEMGQTQQKEQGRPARVWTLSQENKAIPAQIVVGITDGTFSEVMSGDLRDGSEVIVEEILDKKARASTPVPSTKGMK